jgi:hypothetical protein
MNLRYLNRLCLAGLVAITIGCGDDDGVLDAENRGPRALIRFVHAVPDTGAVDFRFVDKVENLPTFGGVPFRGVSGAGYQAVTPGVRPVVIFVNSSDINEAVKRLVDTTITLTANTRYTFVYAGNARGNADRLEVLVDEATLPTPAAGSIMMKILNAAVGLGSVDVTVTPTGTTGSSGTAAATFTGVAYLAQSAYATLPVRPPLTAEQEEDELDNNLYMFNVDPATGPSFSTTPDEPGTPAPAGATYGPVPGMQISGSVLTAVIVPGAVAGSQAEELDDDDLPTNAAPTVIILIDKQINPPATP